MFRIALPLLSFTLLVAAACDGGDDDSTPAGSGGAAGSGGSGSSGSSGEADCTRAFDAAFTVEISGLPADVAPVVSVHNVTESGTDKEPTETTTYRTSGSTLELSAARVYDADPIVRTVYDPKATTDSLCLSDPGEHTFKVSYAAIPSSNKLWAGNANGDVAPLLGFASSVLAESGEPDATVAADAPVGSDLAFDKDGNLWTLGATVAEPSLVRYPAAVLGTSGKKQWDIGLNLPELGCLPQLSGLAFNSHGDLWVSSPCGEAVLRIPQAALTEPTMAKDVASDVQVTGLTGLGSLAFEFGGPLWVTLDGKLAELAAVDLRTSGAPTPFRLLTVEDEDGQALHADYVALDHLSNVWAVDFAGNHVFKVDADNLPEGEATVTATVSITLGVEALLNRPAFDDGGALWISLGAGSFGALTVDQLAESSSAGDPTIPSIIIHSPMTGSYGGLAFFPGAAGLTDLYSSQP